jgi:hypothetical protein
MKRRDFITTSLGLTLLAPTLIESEKRRYAQEELNQIMLEFVEYYKDCDEAGKAETLRTWGELTRDFENRGRVRAAQFCKRVSTSLIQTFGGVQ